MTDPQGTDHRLEDGVQASSLTGDDNRLDTDADVPLTREEALRRDAARADPDHPVRPDDDVPENGPGVPDPSPRPR